MAAQEPALPDSTSANAEATGLDSRDLVVPGVATEDPAWLTWFSGGLVLASLVAFDEPTRQAVLSWDSDVSDGISTFGRWYGHGGSSIPYLLVGTFAIGAATEGVTGIKKGVAIVAGTLAGGLANEAVNLAVGRKRPNEDLGPLRFDPITTQHSSFPSGHTALAFSIAGSIDAVTTGWVPAALAYGAASITGLSRIVDDKHWLTDVVGAAVIGTLVSRTVAGAVNRGLNKPASPEMEATAGGLTSRQTETRPRLSLVAAYPVLALQIRF